VRKPSPASSAAAKEQHRVNKEHAASSAKWVFTLKGLPEPPKPPEIT
jgi:hypothetical protein